MRIRIRKKENKVTTNNASSTIFCGRRILLIGFSSVIFLALEGSYFVKSYSWISSTLVTFVVKDVTDVVNGTYNIERNAPRTIPNATSTSSENPIHPPHKKNTTTSFAPNRTAQEKTGSTSSATKELSKYSSSLPHDYDHYFNQLTTQLQLDLLVPAFGRDERIYFLATKFGLAVEHYKSQLANAIAAADAGIFTDNDTSALPALVPSTHVGITTFRLLVSRFDNDTGTAELQQTLASLAGLPSQNIVMVHANPGQSPTRGGARNLLLENACSENHCLAASVDVDMEVRSEFFHHILETVYLKKDPIILPGQESLWNWTVADYNAWILLVQRRRYRNTKPVVYFPIIWSKYNPETVELVEQYFHNMKNNDPDGTLQRLFLKMTSNPNETEHETLPEFSEHRGKWRPFGKGMFAMRGKDATLVKFNDADSAWGGEDKQYFAAMNRVRRIKRRRETGLIHAWHEKVCEEGQKWTFICNQVRKDQQGSALGHELLKQDKKENPWKYGRRK